MSEQKIGLHDHIDDSTLMVPVYQTADIAAKKYVSGSGKKTFEGFKSAVRNALNELTVRDKIEGTSIPSNLEQQINEIKDTVFNQVIENYEKKLSK